MSPYRSASLARRAPPAPWWRLARRWALDALARVFLGRPRLGPYLLVRALSRVSHEERLRFAYRHYVRARYMPLESADVILASNVIAARAQLRADGHGFPLRYGRPLRRLELYASPEAVIDASRLALPTFQGLNPAAARRLVHALADSVEDTGQHRTIITAILAQREIDAFEVRRLTEAEAEFAEAYPEAPLVGPRFEG